MISEKDIKDMPTLLHELIESLTIAGGACSQLVHSHSPHFMKIRDAIELTKEGLTQEALRNYDKPKIIRAL